MTTQPYIDLLFDPNDLTQQARREVQAAARQADTVAGALQRAIYAEQAYVIAEARRRLAAEKEVNQETVIQVLDHAWEAFAPRFVKISGPQIALVYAEARKRAKAGVVEDRYLYALAEQHARRLSQYFHETSRDALIQGFNTYVNRRVPARVALDKALAGYGLTARQMSGMTANTAFDSKVNTPIYLRAQQKVKDYISKSLRSRIELFATQEEHNLSMQAEQIAWMWKVEQGQAPRAEKVWRTARDEKVCSICGPMHGKVVAVKEQFTLPNGAKVWVPGPHPNCRCRVRFRVPRHLESVEKAWDPREHPRDGKGRFATKRTKQKGITEEDRETYSSNKCGDLALALHDKTGYPIYGFFDDDGWIHAGVVTPDEYFLDVTGKHRLAERLGEWEDFWDSYLWVKQIDSKELAKYNKKTLRATEIADHLIGEEVRKADRKWDPREHPRGGDPENRGRFSAKARTTKPFKEPEIEEDLARARAEELLRRRAPERIDLSRDEPVDLRGEQPISLRPEKPIDLSERTISLTETPTAKPVHLEKPKKKVTVEERLREIDLRNKVARAVEVMGRKIESAPVEQKVLYKNTVKFPKPMYRLINPNYEIDSHGRAEFSHSEEWTSDPAEVSRDALKWRRDQIQEAKDILAAEPYAEQIPQTGLLEGARISYQLEEEDISDLVDWVANKDLPGSAQEWGGDREPVIQVEWYTDEGEFWKAEQLPFSEVAAHLGLSPNDFRMEIAVINEGHDSDLGRTDYRPSSGMPDVATVSGQFTEHTRHPGHTILGDQAPNIIFHHFVPADTEAEWTSGADVE